MLTSHYRCECGMNVLVYKKDEHILTEKHRKKLKVVKLNNELEARKKRKRSLGLVVPNIKIKTKTKITKKK